MRNRNYCCHDFSRPADATAFIKGSEKYPSVNGVVRFYTTTGAVLVKAEISGLPREKGGCDRPVFAFHIHEGYRCEGDEKDGFSQAKGHFNPENCPHPYHAGDMPPLFGVNGKACLSFLTDRFTVREIIGKTVIIHLFPDDFKTQPSGNAGEKIACGVVKGTAR